MTDRPTNGMTYTEMFAALADASAWVEIRMPNDAPVGSRLRREWVRGSGPDRLWVHRDDLPPADPDAALVEDVKRSILDHFNDEGGHGFRLDAGGAARAALAVVREHEARS